MPKVQRKGDPDTGGGRITTGIASVRTNGIPTATINMSVSGHGKKSHSSPKTAGGVPTVKVEGMAISVTGDSDTCGHTRTDGSPDVRAG